MMMISSSLRQRRREQQQQQQQQRVRLLATFLLFSVFTASRIDGVNCFAASPTTAAAGGGATTTTSLLHQRRHLLFRPTIIGGKTRSRLFYRNVDNHEQDQQPLSPPLLRRESTTDVAKSPLVIIHDNRHDSTNNTIILPDQKARYGDEDGLIFFHGQDKEQNTAIILNRQHQLQSEEEEDATGTTTAASTNSSNHHDAMDTAFVSFLGFTLVQGAVAVWANSHSMMADSQAMGVDCLSYFLIAFVERIKTGNHHGDSVVGMKKVSALEWMATFVGIVSLLGVTLCSLHDSLSTLAQQQQPTIAALSPTPNLNLMMLFAVFNLALDLFNRQNFEVTTVEEEQQQQQELVSSSSSFPSMDCRDVGLAVTSTAATPSPLLGNNINRQQQPSSPSLVALSMVAAPTTAHDDDAVGDCHDDNKSHGNNNNNNNLNLSSAQLHVFADTLRSITVLVSAGFAALFPKIATPQQADAYGCICVSIIILFSILPLMQELAGDDPQKDLFDY